MTKKKEGTSMSNIDVTKIAIGYGSHSKPKAIGDDTKVCALEWVSILAGEEKFSDHPKCACPVIASFVRSWNDGMGQSDKGDELRAEFLRPILPLLLNTRVKNDKVILRRAYMALDWLIRVNAPAFLRVAGLTEHADAISSEGEIDCFPKLDEIAPKLSAADSAAESAARSAAYSAADSAADSAAESALAPTVRELQASAHELVKRMCAVTPADVENWHWDTGTAK